MYDICKNVITDHTMDLHQVLRKLDRCWAKGRLTDDQYTELVAMARAEAKPEDGVDVLVKLTELDERVRKLEQGGTAKPTDKPAEYTPGKWYYAGDRVTYQGKVYTCIAPEGQVCTWSPTDYSAYWKAQA